MMRICTREVSFKVTAAFALVEDKCLFSLGAAQQDLWRMCSSSHRAIIWIPINPKSAGSLKRFCCTIYFSYWRIFYFERKEISFMQMHNQFSHFWLGIRQNTGQWHQKLCLKFQILLCFQYQMSFDKGGSFDELLNSASFMKEKNMIISYRPSTSPSTALESLVNAGKRFSLEQGSVGILQIGCTTG